MIVMKNQVQRCLVLMALLLPACAIGSRRRMRLRIIPGRSDHLLSQSNGAHIADPNFAFFWKGKYHLFFITSGGFAHVSSVDMERWRFHPNLPFGGLSGTMFLNRDGIPTMITKTDKIVLIRHWTMTWKSGPHRYRSSRRYGGSGWQHNQPLGSGYWVDNGVTYALFGYFPLDPTKEGR